MLARAALVAAVLVMGAVAVGPAAAPVAAGHQCVMEPCAHNAKELLTWLECWIHNFFGVACP
jgi:hypothetical protein